MQSVLKHTLKRPGVKGLIKPLGALYKTEKNEKLKEQILQKVLKKYLKKARNKGLIRPLEAFIQNGKNKKTETNAGKLLQARGGSPPKSFILEVFLSYLYKVLIRTPPFK